MSWRDDLAKQFDEICDVHMMQIPPDAKIDRSPMTWWRNRSVPNRDNLVQGKYDFGDWQK